MHTRKRDPREMYCSWGKHRVLPAGHIKETFDTGTMCLECQMRIAHGLVEQLGIPEWSAALDGDERRRIAAKREIQKTIDGIRGDSPDRGFVYYLRTNGRIKIGYTANVKSRTRAYPPGSELLAVEPGTRQTEAERHQQFRRYLLDGREWFTEVQPIMDHIAALRNDLGDPSLLAYKYTRHAG